MVLLHVFFLGFGAFSHNCVLLINVVFRIITAITLNTRKIS
jgi:hypothetical protein